MNKRWIQSTVVLIFLFSNILISINFFVDPLQFYRAKERDTVYWEEQRWQLAGLAKNYDYNTVILGTSMTENFIPSEVDRQFSGAKTLKLSMSGSSAYEQSEIANLAFRHKEIKNVIWGIDITALSKDDKLTEEFPKFLYDKNIFNDLNYLLNITTIKYTIASVIYRFSSERANLSLSIVNLNDKPHEDINFLSYWGDLHQYGEEIVKKDYLQEIEEIKKTKNELITQFNFTTFKQNIDNNILPNVEKNPKTNFYFYYPPYSILMNKRFYQADPQIVEDIIKSREYFFSQIKKYPNVKVYDFTTEKDITYNLDLYKDTMHHHPDVNKFILDSFGSNKYLVTDDNLNYYLQEFKAQIEGYSVAQLN